MYACHFMCHAVFPASAGMIRIDIRDLPYHFRYRRVPRQRGDDPAIYESA